MERLLHSAGPNSVPFFGRSNFWPQEQVEFQPKGRGSGLFSVSTSVFGLRSFCGFQPVSGLANPWSASQPPCPVSAPAQLLSKSLSRAAALSLVPAPGMTSSKDIPRPFVPVPSCKEQRFSLPTPSPPFLEETRQRASQNL